MTHRSAGRHYLLSLLSAFAILGIHLSGIFQQPVRAQTVRCEAPVFAAGRPLAAGSAPTSVVAADLNNDQLPDIITANSGADNISVLRGIAGGGFAAAVRYTVEASPTTIVTGYFNADAFTDLAIANSGSEIISILLNKGDGTFDAPQSISPGNFPVTLLAADLNADGKTDLMTTCFFPDQIVIFPGNGNGTFAVPIKIDCEGDPSAITTGDFNADGKTDLAVLNSGSDSLVIFQNKGSLSFTQSATYTNLSVPLAIVAGDFNYDGRTDLVVACSGNNKVALLLASSDGTFAAPAFYPVGSFPWAVTAADVNADGKTDLITANSGSQNVSLLTGDGNGNFNTAVHLQTEASPVAVFAVDLNQDRKSDLLTANSAADSVTLLQNECPAPVNSPPEIFSAAGFEIPRGGANAVLSTFRIRDTESATDKLNVALVSVPPGSITITQIANVSGLVTIRGTAACGSSLGTYSLNAAVTDESGLKAIARVTFRVIENALPDPGRYNDVTIRAGAAMTHRPALSPTDDAGIKSISATAPNVALNVSLTGDILISNQTQPGRFTVTVTTTDNCDQKASTSFVLTVSAGEIGFPPPGTLAEVSSAPSAGQSGSVLIFPVISSNPIHPAMENTRISLTNTHSLEEIGVQIFSIDGKTGTVFNFSFCLKPNQTMRLLASDFDPATMGYLIAVAVNPTTGSPASFNYLIGSESVRFQSGHVAEVGAMAVNAVSASPVNSGVGATAALLEFDGVHYARLPRQIALNSFGSPADRNLTRIFVNAIGGDLSLEPAMLGQMSGTVYNDSDRSYLFSTSADYQLHEKLSNTFPFTTPRLSTAVGIGRRGFLKIHAVSDTALIGTAIHLNPQAGISQGINFHVVSLTAAAKLTIPIAAPSCHPQ
jgi:hypothetical protein